MAKPVLTDEMLEVFHIPDGWTLADVRDDVLSLLNEMGVDFEDKTEVRQPEAPNYPAVEWTPEYIAATISQAFEGDAKAQAEWKAKFRAWDAAESY